MKVQNPYTLETTEIAETTDAHELFCRAQDAYGSWSRLTVRERVAALRTGLERLELKRESLVTRMATEMGKPVSHGRLEFDRAVEEWSYTLEHAEQFLEPEKVDRAEIHFDPLGVVAVISPWNFPLLLPLRGIIPALVAGNAVICKPSELSPQVVLLLAEVFSPQIPFFVATGGKELGARIVALPVRVVAFTGSTEVGKTIAKEAAATLKRVILELGGLDAAIVLADADVAKAAQEIVKANARNTGQVCNAVKRAFVHTSIYERFYEEALAASERLVYGDPLDDTTDIGPLVSETQYRRVEVFLNDAVTKGAKASQVQIPQKGWLFAQTLLREVSPTARLLQEEPFGPLLPILPFATEDEVVLRANDTRFGLTASVWTADPQAFKRIARQLEVGLVRHNTHAAMQSGIPWGGAKESGVGRMKTREGLREFTNTKVLGG
jgi:acyl-CoA reductase-like NAD-dependent aldehyde dehydrogenase